MKHLILERLEPHTSKLGIAWFTGIATWIADIKIENATTWLGFIGAGVGVISGMMIIAIRWDDFVASGPVKRLRERLSRWTSR